MMYMSGVDEMVMMCDVHGGGCMWWEEVRVGRVGGADVDTSRMAHDRAGCPQGGGLPAGWEAAAQKQ